jgi:hypothetical protein
MRLWSLHPRLLDRQGLVALWREGLLAQAVLLGKTRGYTRHPQLDRFLNTSRPVHYLRQYLFSIWQEAKLRGYRFDLHKIGLPRTRRLAPLGVTHGQLEYEYRHLLAKLKRRAPVEWIRLKKIAPCPHPLFRVKAGPVEPWEKTRRKLPSGM